MSFLFFLTSTIILSSFVAKADSTDCQEKLNNKRIEMNVISSNIANLNTTRTSEGGPYQRQEFICSNSKCEIIDEMSNMIKVTRDYEEIVASCK